MMIVEFVGGPKDGERSLMRDGEIEWRVPLPSPLDFFDTGLLPVIVQSRIGVYRAEPYRFLVDHSRSTVTIHRTTGTQMYTKEAWANGARLEYWNSHPVQFEWEGEL